MDRNPSSLAVKATNHIYGKGLNRLDACDYLAKLLADAAFARIAHLERQVQELQEANNREVERRRRAEAESERRLMERNGHALALKDHAEIVDRLTRERDYALREMGRPAVAGFTEHDPHGRAIIDAALELRRVLATHGRRPLASLHEGYGVLAEEVAELFDEVRKRHHDLPAARKEASQVAAVAPRIMAELTEEQT